MKGLTSRGFLRLSVMPSLFVVQWRNSPLFPDGVIGGKRPDSRCGTLVGGPLYLDNFRPEVSQEFRAVRPGHIVGKVKGLEATESGLGMTGSPASSVDPYPWSFSRPADSGSPGGNPCEGS